MIKDLLLKYLKVKFNITGTVISYEEGLMRVKRDDNCYIIDISYEIEIRDREIAITEINIRF